ncbi:hypothetical protein AGMMS50284_5320 [Clostridia bacterium]|nr:hypothetical protein AGMMS50284_5320 [Clostridia bacterium]
MYPKAEKYLKQLNNPAQKRIIIALKRLSNEPPQGDIKNLVGEDGYRCRVCDFRILFDIIDNEIIVHDKKI